MTLKGVYIGLRALEPADVGFLYTVENDPSLWQVSETLEPYSRSILQNYLEHSTAGIARSGQLRLLIYGLDDKRSLGFIDFYEYDSRNSRVGIGIVILEELDRGKGYGAEALNMATDYAFRVLLVHQAFAYIIEDNQASIRLFESCGYNSSGMRRDWVRTTNGYRNQLIYQNINHEES